MNAYVSPEGNRIEVRNGEARELAEQLPAASVDCIVTSPPYYHQRNYEVEGQIGNEGTVTAYTEALVRVFRACRYALRDTGTFWLNIGDAYNGSGGAGGDYNAGGKRAGQPKFRGADVPGFKPKDLLGVPWIVAAALRDDGWYLRSEIIWVKRGGSTDSAMDRPLRRHEQIFLFSKSRTYFFNREYLRRDEDISGKSSLWDVWEFMQDGYRSPNHTARFPLGLPAKCIGSGCPENGTVLDPFCGTGTTLVAAKLLHRDAIGFELNPAYYKEAQDRIRGGC